MYDSVAYIHHVEDEVKMVRTKGTNITMFEKDEKLTGSSKATLGVGAAFGILDILCDTLLLVGAVINKPRFRVFSFIWILWTFITVALFAIVIIMYTVIAENAVDVIRVIFTYGSAIILQLFCIWVVYSYFRLLRFMDEGGARYRVMFNSYHGTPQAEFVSTHSQDPIQDPVPVYSFGEPPTYSDAIKNVDQPESESKPVSAQMIID